MAALSLPSSIYNVPLSVLSSLSTLDPTMWIQVFGGLALTYTIGTVIYKTWFSPYRKIPGTLISKYSTIAGHLNSLKGSTSDDVLNSYFKYGDIYTIAPGFVAISDPSECKHVLGTHAFRKSEIYQTFNIVEDTIFSTADPDLNHMRRRQIGPAFTRGYLAQMEQAILECGILSIKGKWDALLSPSLKDKGGSGASATVNYTMDFSLTTFDIISALGYGQRFHALTKDDRRIIWWVNNSVNTAMLRHIFPILHYFPFSTLIGNMVKGMDEFIAFGDSTVVKRKAQLLSESEKPKDILQVFIDSEDPESKTKMTARQITAENATILIAGTDTTSLTMTWTLHYLMLYPDAYKRVVEEIRSTFTADYLITYSEGRSRLPYLEACIYECMRIQPVSGTLLPRVVPKGGATFQGHFLPEGTIVGVNIPGVNNHKSLWENPRRFVPERFLGNEKAKQQVLTFSTGVRICPGRNLAWAEMVTILANLLKDYDFELPRDSLFGPNVLDEHGNPEVMPRCFSLTTGPRYPDRDCRIAISKAHH